MAKKSKGRPRKFKDVADFEKKTSEFIAKLKEEGKAITPEAISSFLEVDVRTLRNYGHSEGYEEFFPSIKKIMMEVQADFVNKSLIGDYNPSVAIFLMKNNFGYTDRQEVAVSDNFNIEF